jgi:hypothetical protein
MPEDNDALARGDVLPTSDEPEKDESTAAAAPEGEKETPSSDSTPSSEGGEATSTEDDDEPAVAAKDGDSGEKDNRIPKSRFDEAVKRERDRAAAAERELKKLQDRAAQQEQAANFEESEKKVKELLKQHSSLLADGDLDKASEVMADVLQLRDDMNNARAAALAENTRNSTRNEIRYDATVERLEQEYPEINPDSEDFDEGAVRRVQLMVAGIMQSEGKSPADALLEATDILLKPLKEAKASSLRDKPSAEAAEAGLRRTQQQIDKNIQTAAKQPPPTKDVGSDHDSAGGGLTATSVTQMSWEEFTKLPDSELAKMRGDYVN